MNYSLALKCRNGVSYEPYEDTTWHDRRGKAMAKDEKSEKVIGKYNM